MKLPKKIPKKRTDIRNSRKGMMSFNFMAFIPRIIFLVVALLACVILIRLMINAKFWTKPIQAEIFLNGLTHGPGGVTYVDPVTGRIYPEIVDVRQLNGSNIDLGFNFPKNQLMAARMVITDERNEKQGLGEYSDVIGTAYYNKQMWDWWLPLAKSKIKGIGGFDIDDSEFPILYIDESGKLHSGGFMYVAIIQPK